MTRPYRCSMCGSKGHHYKTCPLLPESEGLSNLERRERWRQRRKWAGECTRCGVVVEEARCGKVLCGACAKRAAVSKARARRKRKLKRTAAIEAAGKAPPRPPEREGYTLFLRRRRGGEGYAWLYFPNPRWL